MHHSLPHSVNALTAYEWVILPYVATKNDKPTPEAQDMAQLVDDCLYARPELRQGRWELDFDGLIKNTALAFMRGESVLEIDWGFDAEGSRWVPRRYRKILPKYYAWTTQSDQPDALMLYPNGTGQQPCIPFPENKFIVALGETLGDHPIFANKLVSLIPWYIAAEFGLKEALNFIAHYAQPIKHVKYGAKNQYEEAVAMMKKFGNNTWLVSPKSLELEIINATQSGNGSSPHLALLQAAQNQVDMVIGGQKLASGTTDTGANSRALGEVHNEVRKEVVESMADFVKRVLNTQLIPAILRLNLGELPEHLPSIEFTDPNSHADESKLNFVMRVLETIPVAKQWPYEQLNIPMPEDGAELFEAVGSTPYGGSGTSPFDEEDEDGTHEEGEDDEEDDDEINAADSRRREEPIQVRGKDGEIEECYTKNCKRHGGKKKAETIDEEERKRRLAKAQQDALENYLNPPADKEEAKRRTAEIRERLERYADPKADSTEPKKKQSSKKAAPASQPLPDNTESGKKEEGVQTKKTQGGKIQDEASTAVQLAREWNKKKPKRPSGKFSSPLEKMDAWTEYNRKLNEWQEGANRAVFDAITIPESEREPVNYTIISSNLQDADTAAEFKREVETLSKIAKSGGVSASIYSSQKDRSYSYSSKGEVFMADDRLIDKTILPHELVHLICHEKGLDKPAVGFVLGRIGSNEKLQKLRTLTGNEKYKDNEYAYADDFKKRGNDPYCGKIYTKKKPEDFDKLTTKQKIDATHAQDLLTCGAQRLIKEPYEFALKDPDYFEFTVRSLRK